MSRSHQKTPITGMANAASEKQDKRLANRRLRRIVRESIEIELETMPELREVSTTWTFAKDGKQYFDPQKHPDLMRK